MIKAGMSNSSNANTTDVQYLGEETGFKPQMELAKYLALIGLQKKSQADERYGGYGSAKQFGFGMFGYDPFKNAREAENGPPPAPEPPRTGKPPVEEAPPIGPDGKPIQNPPPAGTKPPTNPPPKPRPPDTGGGGGGTKNPDTGSGSPPGEERPKGVKAPFNDAPFVANVPAVPPTALPPNPSVDELARRWAATSAGRR